MTADTLRDAQLAWAHQYNGYKRLAGDPAALGEVLTAARLHWRRTGQVPHWCGVDYLRGWAFYLARGDHHYGGAALQSGGADDSEFRAILQAIDTHPAAQPPDVPPLRAGDYGGRADPEPLLGDSGPWVRHLATAWQSCAAPGVVVPPPRPLMSPEADNSTEALTARIAHFSPLLHLLVFGLGWSKPDVGISRWIRSGRATNEPVLRAVQQWWADDLAGFVEWLGVSGSARAGIRRVLTGDPTPRPEDHTIGRAPADPDWQRIWGGGWDPMHLTGHIEGPASAGAFDWMLTGPSQADDGVPRAALVAETYVGWYAALQRFAGPTRSGMHDLRIDVTCRPIGWLGQYRRSTRTGLWFRGTHTTHTLGN
ncbi:hypothetical protein [Cellulomonas sp. ATA003]|uniref:hypothetical protein n=1 Tax=Cellulomonas sp. ATA003 TaxID=3073064 RepID=UPI0028733721|nr:hypothetical protein [Cellulomonas sp. ATA003]WNB86439.1 hypothetical protein REH70_04135 [Cellulomonas sp. ATA003]